MPHAQKIHNKKIEITISFGNALAIGSCAGGVIKPLIDFAGGVSGPFTEAHLGLLIVGAGLHIFARSLTGFLVEQ